MSGRRFCRSIAAYKISSILPLICITLLEGYISSKCLVFVFCINLFTCRCNYFATHSCQRYPILTRKVKWEWYNERAMAAHPARTFFENIKGLSKGCDLRRYLI
jgi:hypothetical protein